MNKIKILFLISATRINKKGLVPLICRITYLGKRKPFSTGLFINPKNWSSAKQQAVPLNIENTQINTQINTQLSLIKQEINQAFFLRPPKIPVQTSVLYGFGDMGRTDVFRII